MKRIADKLTISLLLCITVFLFQQCASTRTNYDESSMLNYGHIKIANETTKLMCDLEAQLVESNHNAFILLGTGKFGLVWSYKTVGSKDTTLTLYTIYNGNIHKHYNYQYDKSADWAYKYNEDNDYRFFMEFPTLDANTFRITTSNEDGTIIKHTIESNPFRLIELKDTTTFEALNYYISEPGQNIHYDQSKIEMLLDSIVTVPTDPFLYNLGQDLRTYIFPSLKRTD